MQSIAPILLVLPPFTQMNTPYPSTAYLKGFLNTRNMASFQMDLSLEAIISMFSKKGLRNIFQEAAGKEFEFSENAKRIFDLQHRYISTIDAVILFLQGKSDALVNRIVTGDYLPEASRFTQQNEDLDWAFGSMGTRDRARFMATLYLEDLSDFIQEVIDDQFGFSRYAEQLGRCASSFDNLYKALQQPLSSIDQLYLEVLDKKIVALSPEVVALSVPFPGNLYSSLRCAQYIKAHHPHIKVIMGGGFVNTELREITDVRFFETIDYLLLDDGEVPLIQLIRYLNNEVSLDGLVRTYALNTEGTEVVLYNNVSILPFIKQAEIGTPDYSDLLLDKYISVIEVVNPMHKLWSDGRWNKLTLAHGCYWGKCSFCDGSLDYIKRYDPCSAVVLVDRMEQIIAQTGEIGFHFVDEAAPPMLLKELAIEIIKRDLQVVWWGNIRFEKSYTLSMCRLLKASGCIAVSGGLEVASPRLLKLINKGVTVEQVARVTSHFAATGILVHAYLMYGFPTETAQETIDSLEVVRQLFENGLVQSGFWHRFAMTAHSPVGLSPQAFSVNVIDSDFKGFAKNDLQFEDLSGCKHELFSEGLRTSLFNYMHDLGYDLPLQKWFKTKVPNTTIKPTFIANLLDQADSIDVLKSKKLYWFGSVPKSTFNGKFGRVILQTQAEEIQLEFTAQQTTFIISVLTNASNNEPVKFEEIINIYENQKIGGSFDAFWFSEEAECLRENGLYLL